MERGRVHDVALLPDVPLSARRLDRVAVVGVAAAVLVFLLVQLTQAGLQQDDPYHLALAELIYAGDRVRALVWAKHTVLASRFGDLHFGYHAALAPFVGLFGAPLGGELLTTLSVVVLALVVVAIAGRAHPLRAMLPALVLFSSGDFLLRAMGMRPIALGAAAVLAVLPLAFAGRFVCLAVVGALFAFSYAAFPLLLLPLVAHATSRMLLARELAWRPTASVLVGFAIGVVLHPDAAAYLDVLSVQLFDVTGGRGALNLEYAPRELGAILADLWLVFIVTAVGAYAAWRARSDRDEAPLAWTILTALTLGLALRYHRGVDTFVPVAVTFTAVAIRQAGARVVPPRSALLVTGLALVICAAMNVERAWTTSRSFEAIDAHSAAVWLARNSDPGDEVFLQDYGAFPRLFYADRRNVYTLGLEPAFMRAHDPVLFGRYLAAVRLEADPYPLIRETGARYVYVERTPNGRPFYAYLRAQGAQYHRVYEDDFAAVFAVR